MWGAAWFHGEARTWHNVGVWIAAIWILCLAGAGIAESWWHGDAPQWLAYIMVAGHISAAMAFCYAMCKRDKLENEYDNARFEKYLNEKYGGENG